MGESNETNYERFLKAVVSKTEPESLRKIYHEGFEADGICRCTTDYFGVKGFEIKSVSTKLQVPEEKTTWSIHQPDYSRFEELEILDRMDAIRDPNFKFPQRIPPTSSLSRVRSEYDYRGFSMLQVKNYIRAEKPESDEFIGLEIGIDFHDDKIQVGYSQNGSPYPAQRSSVGIATYPITQGLLGAIITPEKNISLVVREELLRIRSDTQGEIPEDVLKYFDFTTGETSTIPLTKRDSLDDKVDSFSKNSVLRASLENWPIMALWTYNPKDERILVYNDRTRQVLEDCPIKIVGFDEKSVIGTSAGLSTCLEEEIEDQVLDNAREKLEVLIKQHS